MATKQRTRVAVADPAPRALTLGVLAVGLSLLWLFGPLPAWPGAAHHVALPPLDLFADVRLLIAVAPTWPAFAAGLAASLALRVLVLALLLGRHTRTGLRFALSLYAVALPVALLAGWASWAAHSALYSGLHWIAVGLATVTVVVLGATAWTGQPTVRAALGSAWPHGLRAAALLVYVGGLTTLGAVAAAMAHDVSVLAIPASAALTLGAITWLSREPNSDARPYAGVAVAVVVAGVLLVATAGEPESVTADGSREGSLVAMSGMNSASGQGAVLEVDHPQVFGYDCDDVYYISYAGPGDGQPQGEAVCPIRTGAPYTEEDTRQQTFDEQVDHLVAQVNDLPDPVTLLAHSQGAWVAWEAAADGRLDGLVELVVIGPFPDGPRGYPPAGAPGAGRIGADVLRWLEPVTALIGFVFHPDEPLARDILAPANAPRSIYEQPLPEGIRAFSVTGVGDLAIKPGGWRLAGAQDGCPVVAPHPDLPLAPETKAQINAFLDGEEPAPCPTWRLLVHPIGLAWSPPPAQDPGHGDR